MPRQEISLSVFVASPSDVADERDCLNEVITEINNLRARDLGVRLELVRWETHAYPGFSADAQQVINETVPQDCDIFIGIMWQRFGTATGRAQSGTIEEFRTAKQRYDKNPRSVRIMIYFKDQPVSLSAIDPQQLALISDFRKELGPAGGLYWHFDDTAEFEKLVRIHLQRALQDWRDDSFALSGPLPTVPADEPEDDLPDEPGLIDLALEFTEKFSDAATKMAISNLLINDAGQQLSTFGQKFSAQGKATNSYQLLQIKTLSSEMAAFLRKFNADLSEASNSAADSVDAGIDAMIKFMEIQPTLRDEDEASAVELLDTMDAAQNSIDSYRETISQTAGALSAWPSVTAEINSEKKKLIKTFNNVIDRQIKSISLIKELKRSIFSLINRRNSDME